MGTTGCAAETGRAGGAGAGAAAGAGIWTGGRGGPGGFGGDCAGVSGRASRFFKDIRVTLEISLSVSKTPMPVKAEASTCDQPPRLRAAFISSTGRMSGRSRLLNWRTIGRVSRDSPISAMFSSRLRNDSMLACSIGRWESATNTMPSTPLSTSLRVVL